MLNIKIIAEIGVNHNGKIRRAKKLIDIAKKNKAHFVKFQMFNTTNLVTKNANKAGYQNKNDSSKNQYEMLKKYQLSEIDLIKLRNYSRKKKINFLVTPFDNESLDLIIKMKLSYIKISSGDINNYPLLKKIGKQNKKLFLSTGMSTNKEINNAIKILTSNGTRKKNIVIFQCTSSYPTPNEDANLNVINTFKKIYNHKIGFSDHTKSTDTPCYAAIMGAEYIEKHITINNNDNGPDHEASLNIEDFTKMMQKIEVLKKLLGSKVKKIAKSEKLNKYFARRSIYAKKYIKKGHLFSEENIVTKRPEKGLDPMKWDKIIGSKAKKNFKVDEPIKI